MSLVPFSLKNGMCPYFLKMGTVPCVVFLLVKMDRFLVERRKPSARVDPGAVALPGGHVEDGESLERALVREMGEELGVVPRDYEYLCTLHHRSVEFQQLHYFWVSEWDGELACREAEAVWWVPLSQWEELDLEVDRVAVREYLRLFHNHSELPDRSIEPAP